MAHAASKLHRRFWVIAPHQWYISGEEEPADKRPVIARSEKCGKSALGRSQVHKDQHADPGAHFVAGKAWIRQSLFRIERHYQPPTHFDLTQTKINPLLAPNSAPTSNAVGRDGP